MTCQQAMGVAEAMKDKYREGLDLKIYDHTSKEAEKYDLKASTAVFVNEEYVPLDIAIFQDKMYEFLSKLENR